MCEVTPEFVQKILDYDPETGIFRAKTGRKVGQTFGSKMAHGYVMLSIGKLKITAHRMAWLYVHGRWPADQIDHINGDAADNRIANLRECTHAENHQNEKLAANNRVGLRGVYLHRPSGRYAAEIKAYRKRYHLGYFDTAEEAYDAYLAAKARLHEFQPFVRTPAGKDMGL